MTLLRSLFGSVPRPLVGATNIYGDPDSAPYPHVRAYERDGVTYGLIRLTANGPWLPLAKGGDA